MPAENNKDAFRRWIQAWNEHDLDALDQMVASDFRTYYQGNPEPVDSGLQDHQDRVDHSFEIYPDVVTTIQEVVAEGDLVMGLGTLTGTHVGQSPGGAKPDNRKWSVKFAVLTRWDDGKLVEERRFWGTWAHVD